MAESRPLLPKTGRDAPDFLTKLDYWLILPALLSNMFLAAFENTIAASTQSAVGTSFSASDNIAWVATSYLIVSTAVQPLYGRSSDLFGRTPVYLFSLFFFAVGCFGCGMSTTLGQIIAARAICGIGGGGLITISQVCAWDVLPIKHRPLYQAMNNVTYGLGGAVGASLGGLLSDSIGWRWAYFLPVPFCLFSVLAFLFRARPKLALLREGESTKLKLSDIDIVGSLLLMVSITLLMIVFNLGGDEIPWTSPTIPILLSCCLLTSIVFILYERSFPLPVLPISLLKGRHMASQIGLNLFGAMAIFATLFLIPPFFQTTLLTSASVASRRLLYPTLTAPIGSILTGLFLHRNPTKYHVGQALGSTVLLAGTIVMALLAYEQNEGRGELWFISHLVWVHLGMGILFISSLLDILSSKGKDHAAATSLIFLIRSLGTVIGISGSQAVLQNVVLYQLKARITGPGSGKVIKDIRESVTYLAGLEPSLRAIAVDCYRQAFRASFQVVIAIAGFCVLSAVLGLGARKTADVDEDKVNYRVIDEERP